MEWSDIKVFLAVARAGTLGGAARLTGQSQPTMGRRLRALEEALGQTLFQRGAEGFVLTDEGNAVLAHAQRMEDEALGLQRRLDGRAQQLEGTLRVSSSDWFCTHMLTPVIADFVAAHPGVVVELITDARLFSLARREADLVLRIKPFDEAEIVQRKLLHVDYRLYAPKGMKRPRKGDGAGCALVTLDEAFRDMPDAAWLKKMLPNARIAFGSNSRDAQARMCAAGAGLAVLPRPLGDSTPGLVSVNLGEPPPGRDVWLGYHRDLRALQRLRALVDLMVERLAN
jgi:DNA-binding transcriptional LysR family regulator